MNPKITLGEWLALVVVGAALLAVCWYQMWVADPPSDDEDFEQ